MNTVAAVEFFFTSLCAEMKKEISEFLLFYGMMIVHNTTDIPMRMLSLTHCKRLVSLLNFLDEEQEGKPLAGKYSFAFWLTAATTLLTTVRRAVSLSAAYTYQPLQEIEAQMSFFFWLGIASDITMNFRGVYIYAVSMLMGFRLLQCYEDFCLNFRLTCLRSDGKHIDGYSYSSKGSAMLFNSKFIKFQDMFESFHDIAGDYALALIICNVFQFIHFIYDVSRAETRWDGILACAGIIECLLILFSLGSLGNTMELKVNEICGLTIGKIL
jgi:hypothetical protein